MLVFLYVISAGLQCISMLPALSSRKVVASVVFCKFLICIYKKKKKKKALLNDEGRTWKRGKMRKWIKRRDELGHFNTSVQELRMEDMPVYKEMMRNRKSCKQALFFTLQDFTG